MRIAEIFHSLQGEGSLAGVPSVFVRTSGCNLRCGWCDTPYASWEPEGDEQSVEAIVAAVRRHPARHVVLTGGEPMIQPELPALAAALRAAGYHLTIETAATVAPGGIACDLASLSPKLSNSAPGARAEPGWRERHEQRRRQPAVLAEWLRHYEFQLKFVVAAPADLAEIDALLAALPGGPPPAHKVLLMPEGTEPAALAARTAWLIDLCRTRGHRLAPRLHIEWFGHTRGT
jgi:7-carboxy-7-deazaguanine synthase